jgi:hypothetical protein
MRRNRCETPERKSRVTVLRVTIRVTSAAFQTQAKQMWLGYNLPRIPAGLVQGIALERDYVCHCLGECIYREEIDSEIGDLVGMPLPGPKWFSYVRYNRPHLGKRRRNY